MKTLLQTLMPNATVNCRAYRLLIRNPKSYLHTSGWMKSIAEKCPLDNDGNAYPWMNYALIRLLNQRLQKDFRVFEFGSGFSTLFFAKRVGTITSVEYNPDWYEDIRRRLPDNAEVIFQEQDYNGQYCRTIGRIGGQFDIILVDGRDRVNCVFTSLPYLSERGVILLDDTHRAHYHEAVNKLKSKDFRALTIEGLKPSGTEMAETTILYRDNNCLGI